jgi:hypothetical protein
MLRLAGMLVGLVLLCALTSSCGSSKFASFKSPAYDSVSFSRVLVVTKFKYPAYRALSEKYFVHALDVIGGYAVGNSTHPSGDSAQTDCMLTVEPVFDSDSLESTSDLKIELSDRVKGKLVARLIFSPADRMQLHGLAFDISREDLFNAAYYTVRELVRMRVLRITPQ